MDGKVLYVDLTATQERHGAEEITMAALEADAATDVASDLQEDTLLHFYQRFRNLMFDAIERPIIGIRLTRNKRIACVSCIKVL